MWCGRVCVCVGGGGGAGVAHMPHKHVYIRGKGAGFLPDVWPGVGNTRTCRCPKGTRAPASSKKSDAALLSPTPERRPGKRWGGKGRNR